MREEVRVKVQNRLKRLEGQVRGLQKMVAANEYCVKIINQAAAVRQALSAVENMMLENHLSEHVIHQMRSGESDRAVGEIIKVFKISKKK
jgi:DNA-binding FrmR family transcriptional regulator